MSVETLILAAVLALAIHTVRSHHQLVRGVWREAAWYERLALLLCLAPVPGPFDELAGFLVVRRVVRRRTAR